MKHFFKWRREQKINNFHSRYRIEINGCWVWSGYVPRGSYPGFINDYGSHAHRFSYSHFVGKIPKGRWVLHKCDNKLCVNPDHLELGDHKKNMRDAVLRNRFDVKRKDTCYIRFDRKRKTIKEWSKIFKLTPAIIYSRFHRGWKVTRIFKQPLRRFILDRS